MNYYTVLLLRPDYIADEFGKDTYLAHVVANGAAEAQGLAQRDAWFADEDGLSDDPDDPSHPSDYHVLFCTMGHLRDLSRDSEGEAG